MARRHVLWVAVVFLATVSLLFLFLDASALRDKRRNEVVTTKLPPPPEDAYVEPEVAQHRHLERVVAEQLGWLSGPVPPVDVCVGSRRGGCFEGGIVLLHQGRCGSTVLMRTIGWNNPATTDIAFPDIPSPEVSRSCLDWQQEN